MRLKAIVPALPVQLITALEDCGIRTDTDILFTSGTAMQVYEKLPLGTVTLAQLEQYIQRVVEAASATMTGGEELLAQEEAQSATFNPILTGVPQLDEIINGSNGPKVLEISGDHGTGKTVFALQVVMRHLATHADHAALWIDTTGDFSVERLQPFITLYDDLVAESRLLRLQLSLAFDVYAIQEILDALKSGFSPQGQMHKVRYMVMDSITPIFRPLLSIVSSQGHAMMTSFMQQLRWLADTHSMTILVLNATSSAVPQNSRSASTTNLRKPALGPSFAYMTDATLWLSTSLQRSSATEDADNMDEDQHEVRVHVAEVLRSKYTASKTHCSFRINDGVLQGT
ncbi:P-loop containing nucleoside triphosphate hydrolase protein [Irpex lacteus]|nr:P-loop containing nucleoside triphosphate hydrolase protein [Irpex lacteus]